MRSLIALSLLALAATANAKEYNKPDHLASPQQALINRVQADIVFRAEDNGGYYGSFEGDCNELNVGSVSDAARPDQQVIVADQIINVAGHCRMIRSTGGFASPAETTKTPTEQRFDELAKQQD